MPKSFLLTLAFLATLLAAPVYAPGETIRAVTVTALVDKDDFRDASRLDSIKTAIALSSEIFEKEFRIAFELRRFVPWDYPAQHPRLELNAVLQHLQKRAKKADTDIVLAFTSKPIYGPASEEIDGEFQETIRAIDGSADKVLGRAAFVRIFIPPTNFLQFVTLHELLHLFGAENIYGGTEPSIMRNPYLEHIIDEKTRAIVLKNRERDFKKK